MKDSHYSLKLILLITLLIGIVRLTTAQVTLTGVVTEENGSALPYTNVLLLNPGDSSLVQGEVTNVDGHFKLTVDQEGDYLLMASMIGYASHYNTLSLTGKPHHNLETITMYEDTQELDEVVVTAMRPLYERQMDRTVVNVQSSITSTGNSALEVLDRSPGVTVNRGNSTLSMNGKSTVQVMINGKLSRLPIDAVVQMLDGMSAANIEKIELITTPPAKYDAEGDAGLINIVMISQADEGTNGNVGFTLGHNGGENLGTNFNLNHRKGKFNFFADYSILSDRNKMVWLNERTLHRPDFSPTVSNRSDREARSTVQNLRTGIDYTFNARTSAQVLITGYRRNWDMDALTVDLTQPSPDSLITTSMNLHEKNVWQSMGGSLAIRHQLTEQQSLSGSFDYLYYVNDNPSTYDIETSGETSATSNEQMDVTKDTPIRLKIAQLDYSNQLRDNLSLELGMKSSFSHFSNEVAVQRMTGNSWQSLGEFSNQSQLDERIYAAYVSAGWQPTKLWKINGGLRYEYTDSFLSSPEEGTLVDREFDQLFPNLSLLRSFSEESSIQLAYSKRINRPTFNDMAPFVIFAGPSTFVGGNPGLLPAITNGIDLTYRMKQWWVTLQYSNSRNSIGMLQPEIDPETNVQVFRSQNLKYLRTWSMSTSLPVTITSWWEAQGDVTLNYQTFESQHLIDNYRREVFGVNLNITSTMNLGKSYAIELNGNYTSGALMGMWEFEPMGQLNLGVRKKLNRERGVITLTFNDILHTNVWKISSEIPEANASTNTYYDFNLRAVNLTYTLRFGNKKLKSVNIKGGAREERSRVN